MKEHRIEKSWRVSSLIAQIENAEPSNEHNELARKKAFHQLLADVCCYVSKNPNSTPYKTLFEDNGDNGVIGVILINK